MSLNKIIILTAQSNKAEKHIYRIKGPTEQYIFISTLATHMEQ